MPRYEEMWQSAKRNFADSKYFVFWQQMAESSCGSYVGRLSSRAYPLWRSYVQGMDKQRL